MTNWNPSAPTTIGPEFLPSRSSTIALSSTATTNVPAEIVYSSVAETITALSIHMGSASGNGRVLAEVYAGTALSNTPTRADRIYLPSLDVSRTGWTTFAGGTSNLYTHIDENPYAPNNADGIREPSGSTSAAFSFRVNSAAFPSGRRVGTVQIVLTHFGGDVEVGFVNGGNTYVQRTGISATGSFRRVVLSWGEICPWTGLPWTQADIVGLSNGTTTVRIRRADASAGWTIPQVSAVGVQVFDYPEDRLAYAVGPVSFGTNDYDLPIYTPTAGGPPSAGWSKAAGTNYLVVFRGARMAPGQGVTGTIRQVLSPLKTSRLPTGAPRALAARVNPDGTPVSSGASDQYRTITLGLRVGSATSVDSSPWVTILSPNLATTPNRQDFTPSVSASYGVLRAMVKVPAGGSLTRLRMVVRRASDSVQVGGEAQLTREQALEGTDMGDGWFLAQAQLGAPAALVGGTTYRIEFSLVNGSDPWTVAVLGDRVDLTDQFEAAAAQVFYLADKVFAVQIAQVPSVLPGVVTVAESSLPVSTPHAPTLDGCAPETVAIPVARIGWPTSNLGGSFGGYEVERSDERDPVWRLVGAFSGTGTTEFFDNEVRLGGVATRYRVRQLRADGVASDWITSAPVRFSAPAPCHTAMVWSSNADIARTVLAPDLAPTPPSRSYEILESEDLTIQPIYGRDGMVAFRALERRGVRFTREVTVDALIGSSGRPRGETVFDAFRALVSARDLPYVCVRDDYGDRWFAAVNLTEAVAAPRPTDLHTAMVTVTELDETPNIVTSWNGFLGGAWQQIAGGWGVDSSVDAARLFEVAPGPALAVMPSPFADRGAVTVEMMSGGSPVHARFGIAAKVVDVQNYVGLTCTSVFDGYQLFKVVGGTKTVLASWSAGFGSLELRWDGRSSPGMVVRAYESGTLRGTATITDPVFDGESRAGLLVESPTTYRANNWWKNFEVFDPAETPGAPWNVASGTWRAEGSVLRPIANNVAPSGRNVATVATGSPDAAIRWRVTKAGGDLGLVLRYVDASNYLVLQAAGPSSGWNLISRIAGTETVVQSYPAAATVGTVIAQVWGDRFRFRTPHGWEQTITLPAAASVLASSGSHGVRTTGDKAAFLYLPEIDLMQADPVLNIGAAGAALSRSAVRLGGVVDVVRDLPSAPVGLNPDDLFVAVAGLDDAAGATTAAHTRAWFEALRTMLSRVFRDTDVADTAGTITYAGTWATVTNSTQGSGTGWRSSSTAGSTATFSASSGAGRTVAISFLASNSVVGAGGVAEILLDGAVVGTMNTALWTGTTNVTPLTFRLPVPPGAHTVTVRVASGSVAFDGWGFELHPDDPANPTAVVANVPAPANSYDLPATLVGPSAIGAVSADWTPSSLVGRTVRIYSGTGSGQTRTVVDNSSNVVAVSAPWTTLPDASSRFIVEGDPSWGDLGRITRDVLAIMNTAVAAVVAEFGASRVAVADLASVFDGRPDLYYSAGPGLGGIYPNETGHRLAAQKIAEAIPGGPRRFSRLVLAGNGYVTGLGTLPDTDLGTVLRRTLIAPVFADGFDRPAVPRYADTFDR